MALLYGKIKNGVLEYAPENYISSVITIQNFNQDESLMQEFGYKKVIEDGYIGGEYVTYQEIEESDNCIIIHNVLDNSEEVLKEIKTNLIYKTKTNLERYLEENPLLSSIKCSNIGETKEYTVTIDKQNQLTATVSNFITNALPYILDYMVKGGSNEGLLQFIDSLPIDIYWNSKGETCEKWKYSEIFQLKNEMMEYIRPIVEYQRILEVNILKSNDQAELYDMDLEFTKEKIEAFIRSLQQENNQENN